MTIFHRFCRIFPLLLGLTFFTGCTGGPVWNVPAGPRAAAPAETVYGQSQPPPAPIAAPQAKVAILLPLTGTNAALGSSMLQAAQLAMFDQNFDGFQLLPVDTAATSAGAAAKSALDQGAQLILGPLFANDVRAVKAATAGRNVTVIAYSTDWTLAGGNVFLMGFLPATQVERIADYAAAKGVKRVVVAAPADQYGAAVGAAFEARAATRGITTTRDLADSSAGGVFIPAGGAALQSLLPRIAASNAQKLGTGLWDDPAVVANPVMNGAWFAAPAPSARADFERRYRSTYGAAPVRLSTLAYDSAALAITLARGGAAFTAASLTNPNGFAGVDGIIRFNGNGLAERGMAVLAVQGGHAIEIDPAPTSFAR